MFILWFTAYITQGAALYGSPHGQPGFVALATLDFYLLRERGCDFWDDSKDLGVFQIRGIGDTMVPNITPIMENQMENEMETGCI